MYAGTIVLSVAVNVGGLTVEIEKEFVTTEATWRRDAELVLTEGAELLREDFNKTTKNV